MKIYVPCTLGSRKVVEYEADGPISRFNGKIQFYQSGNRQFHLYSQNEAWFTTLEDANKAADEYITVQIARHMSEIDRLSKLYNNNSHLN